MLAEGDRTAGGSNAFAMSPLELRRPANWPYGRIVYC